MSPSDVAEIINNITYKPGWKFIYEPHLDRLVIKVKTPDSDGLSGTEMLQHQREGVAEAFINETTLLEWIQEMVAGLEQHEFQEWFKLKGRRVYEPHLEVNRDYGQTSHFVRLGREEAFREVIELCNAKLGDASRKTVGVTYPLGISHVKWGVEEKMRKEGFLPPVKTLGEQDQESPPNGEPTFNAASLRDSGK